MNKSKLEKKLRVHLNAEKNYRRYVQENKDVLCKWETDIEDLVASIVSKKEVIFEDQKLADKHARKANKLKQKLEDSKQ